VPEPAPTDATERFPHGAPRLWHRRRHLPPCNVIDLRGSDGAVVSSALLSLRGERQRYCQRSEEESGTRQSVCFGFHVLPPGVCPAPHGQIVSASASSNSICAFKSIPHRSVGHRSLIVWKCFDTERVRWEQGQNARSTSAGKSVCLLGDVNDAVNSFLTHF
jgi:hypothetical protein